MRQQPAKVAATAGLNKRRQADGRMGARIGLRPDDEGMGPRAANAAGAELSRGWPWEVAGAASNDI